MPSDCLSPAPKGVQFLAGCMAIQKKQLYFPVSLADRCGHMAVSGPMGRDGRNKQTVLLLGRGVSCSFPLLLEWAHGGDESS